MADEKEITGMYELLDALEETLRAADPAKREAFAKTIDAYQEDFPDDFHWAVGAHFVSSANVNKRGVSPRGAV